MIVTTVKNWYTGYREGIESTDVSLGYIQESDTTLHLFAIQDPAKGFSGDGIELRRTLYNLFTNFLDKHFPGKKVTDFNWKFTAGGAHTNINFVEQNGYVVGVEIGNGFATSGFMSCLKETYDEAIASPAHFIDILTEGHPERYTSGRLRVIIVPLPNHPKGHIVLPSLSDEDYDRNYEVVFADSKKVLEHMIHEASMEHDCSTLEDLKAVYDAEPSKGDDVAFPPFHTSLETSIKYLRPEKGYPDKVPQASYWSIEAKPTAPRGVIETLLGSSFGGTSKPEITETLRFTNGRHRTVNMIVAGAPFIPMQMYKCDDTERFKSSFLWGSQKTSNRLQLDSLKNVL